MSVRQQIRSFILQNYLFTEEDSKLSDTASLMDSGVMDSTGILELIMFLEERFLIKVADEEMIPANLDSVASAAAFVERKQSVG